MTERLKKPVQKDLGFALLVAFQVHVSILDEFGEQSFQIVRVRVAHLA